MDGPDHAIIELNTSANHNFGHLHLFKRGRGAAITLVRRCRNTFTETSACSAIATTLGRPGRTNTQGISLRERQDASDLVKSRNPPKDVEFFLGSRHQVRFLKKEGYGKFAILSSGA